MGGIIPLRCFKPNKLALLRFAILGFGNIGQRHARILHHMPEAELVAIIEPDKPTQKAAGELQGYRLFDTLEDFLDQGPEADVVNVCTPNGWHYTHASQVLSAGMHVLVEKPLTLTAEACYQLAEQARAKGLGLFGVLQNRYSPPAQWLKTVIKENRLGQVFMVSVNCYWNRGAQYYEQRNWRGTAALDGGPLYTQFSHFVDLLPWVFGELEMLDGQFYNFSHQAITDFEDSGVLSMRLSSGAPVTLTYSTAAYQENLESSITVLGAQGALKIGGQYMDQVVHCRIANYEAPAMPATNPPNQYGPFQGSAANHHQVLTNVVKALAGGPCEVAEGTEAAESISLIEQAYQIRQRKGIQKLNTPSR
jgi:predicted dehydrogenase